MSMEAIVVLGSSIYYPQVMRDRVAHGIRMVAERGASILLLTGGPNNREKIPESSAMLAIASELGFESTSVVVEDESMDTIGNARLSAPILRDLGCDTIGLVTSAYHMFRAAVIFRATLPEMTCVELPCEDRFSRRELRRRLENERRQYYDLPSNGIAIPDSAPY